MNDDLSETVEQLKTRVEALEDELEDEHERRQEAEQRVEELENWQNEHDKKHDALSNWLDSVEEDVAEIGTQVEAVDGATTNLESMQEDELAELLPIEKLARLPEPVAEAHLNTGQSRNLWRARFIWKNIESYSTAVGDAENRRLRITSAEMIRILKAAEDGNSGIESKTTERVMDRLVDWTHGLAEVDRKDGERRIHVPGDWADRVNEVDQSQAAASDAVVSGGR